MADEKQPPLTAPQLEQQPGLDDELDAHLIAVSAAVQNIIGPLKDNPDWNAIVAKHQYAAACIKAGRERGIPPEYLSRCAYEFLEPKVKGKHYRVVANFLKNVGLGTADQIKYFEELAIAQEQQIQMEKEAASETFKTFASELYAEASMADLFELMEHLPRGLYHLLIDKLFNDLGDYYPDFTKLRDDRAAAEGIRVSDFFDDIMDPEDPELPVPITWIAKAMWDVKQRK